MIRDFLSYLPSSVDELPPLHEPYDPVDHEPDELLDLVPKDPRRTHDAHRLIELVVDEGSFFEIAPRHGRARITGLARIEGHPVGIMANDPRHLGGATDVAAGAKAARLIQLCDLFHLPLVDLVDEPGLMVGLGLGAPGHRARRRPTGVHQQPVAHAVDRDHRPPPVRRRRPGPPPPGRDVPPLRLAERAVGFDAHRRRRVGGVPPGDRGGRRSRRQADRDRGAPRAASAHRSAPRRRPARTSSTPADTRAVVAEFVEDAQRVLRHLGTTSGTALPPLPYLPYELSAGRRCRRRRSTPGR